MLQHLSRIAGPTGVRGPIRARMAFNRARAKGPRKVNIMGSGCGICADDECRKAKPIGSLSGLSGRDAASIDLLCIDEPMAIEDQQLRPSVANPVRHSVVPDSFSSIFFGSTSPTGEPDAGDPHVRFGGRGSGTQSSLPTPIHSAAAPRLPSVKIMC